MLNRAKISNYKIEKILKHFCVDIIASKTAALVSMNRNTINHWYMVFRKAIYAHQMKEFEKIIGEAEVDESYFVARRKRGFDGLVDVGNDKHFRVNHGENEFSKGSGIHINGIENFWSFTKRRLSKFNGVKVNFELHLKECEWRYGRDFTLLETELKTIVKYY